MEDTGEITCITKAQETLEEALDLAKALRNVPGKINIKGTIGRPYGEPTVDGDGRCSLLFMVGEQMLRATLFPELGVESIKYPSQDYKDLPEAA